MNTGNIFPYAKGNKIAEASVRIQPTARSTGEAAGIGAALAIEAGKSIREIGGADVRAIMIEKGAKFA